MQKRVTALSFRDVYFCLLYFFNKLSKLLYCAVAPWFVFTALNMIDS